MKKFKPINQKPATLFLIVCAMAFLVACNNRQERLIQRVAELCKYIPNPDSLERSKDYMTADFYAVLDTLFHLPDYEAMDHEWLHYFVTSDGGAITDFEVVSAQQTDASHVLAIIKVRQKWEDDSDETSDIERHQLYVERIDGKWLMSDFDKHKEDCMRHLAIRRHEDAQRNAISEYLINKIGADYRKGEVCIPTIMIVAEEPQSPTITHIYGDFWIFWYNLSDDTLKTISGGNHSGCMTLTSTNGQMTVTDFEQTADGSLFMPSAKRIFGNYYEIYQNMQSSPHIREAIRREQLRQYIHHHNLNAHFYQDYEQVAVKI